jgi:murein DD-endopeptidase MepM/ murein hydrolase activator NlpD
MAQKWTIVLVPHGAGESRSVSISPIKLRILSVAVGVVAVATVVFAYATINRAVDLSRLDRLERRNDILSQDLDRAQRRLAGLGDSIAVITERDQLVRLLAGLEPTDPDVQLAGVGGPAGTWTPREELLAEAPEGRAAISFRTELDNYIRRANLLAGSYIEAVDSLESHTDQLRRTPSISPIPPSVGWFTSPYANIRMHPIYNEPRPHPGIDVYAPHGTAILAPANGRIAEVRTVAGYGKTVTVDHGYGVQTFYAHCSRTVVQVGERVERGDKIAEVGKTGTATGPHLHYEVLVNRRRVNPKDFIFPNRVIVD